MKDGKLVDQENSSRVAVITGSGTDAYAVVLAGRTEATLRQTVPGPDGLFAAHVLDDHFPQSTGLGREPA